MPTKTIKTFAVLLFHRDGEWVAQGVAGATIQATGKLPDEAAESFMAEVNRRIEQGEALQPVRSREEERALLVHAQRYKEIACAGIRFESLPGEERQFHFSCVPIAA